ncbi:UvrD-helicase domain-containing protein, partial [Patescibacteria group bacterium]|nr:UvrD-helicase domain-containing protein [Patescibacteria group bacterium]
MLISPADQEAAAAPRIGGKLSKLAMDILSSLNPKQREAAAATRGPVLVIAGPGSGKTRCLTHRIVYLIQKGICPDNILAVTFTNKAAEEMRDRVRKLLDDWGQSPRKGTVPEPTIGTFHSVCLRILRRDIGKLSLDGKEGYKNNFVIYDTADQLSLIKKAIKDLEISPDQFKPASVQAAISRAKDELIDANSYAEQAREYFPKTVAKIYLAYQAALKKSNALDFDDLIMLTEKLLRENPSVLEKYQNKWQYLSVDEAHDTNFSQYALIKMLAEKHKNLWFIADTDQSIYSWRGADFRNILNFEKDYPEAKLVLLEENYRSTKNILEASYHIIAKNTQRKEKKLWTKNPEGSLINIIQTNNETEEGDFLIEEIVGLMSAEGLNLNDFAVLYRTNAQSRAIEEAFLKAGLPYKIVGSVRFYERKEVKDILAYLKIISNPDDLAGLKRVINTPPRGIGKITVQKEISNRASRIFESKNAKIKNFAQLISELKDASQKEPLTELIKMIIDKTEYENYVRKISPTTEEGERRWENIQELLTIAGKYDSLEKEKGLEQFLEEIILLTGADELSREKGIINLMTLHCAKGLEFPVVFIVGCEEGIFPHSRSLLATEQIEEERRLCYVGITRAKQKAYLTFAARRCLYGQTMANPPSRFISNIP